MSGRTSRPVCHKCGLEMTPENSKLAPELFRCDMCVPDDISWERVLERRRREAKAHPEDKFYAGPAEAEGPKGYIPPRVVQPVVNGLVLNVTGKELIDHCMKRVAYWKGVLADREKKRLEAEDRRRKLEEEYRNSPNPRAYPMADFFGLPTVANYYPDPEVRCNFFTFVMGHADATSVYRLDTATLTDLEWF